MASTSAEPACHESTSPDHGAAHTSAVPDSPRTHDDGACPMRGVDGRACTMHHHTSGRGTTCVLKGTCAGPMATLATLLFFTGVPVARSGLPVISPGFERLSTLPAGTLDRSIRPDSPPPRSSRLA